MASKIYFIRHGITEGNIKQWFYGTSDLHLTEEGKETLRELKGRGAYPDIPDDADCYTSALTRTDETFQIIFGDRPRKAFPLFNEIGFGDYECRTYEQLKELPWFDTWQADKTGDVRPPGGESRNDFTARISKGMEKLVGLHRKNERAHSNGTDDAVSVVVCHGGVIAGIMHETFPDVKGVMWDWIPVPGMGYVMDFEEGKPCGYENISDIDGREIFGVSEW
jgi:alpha-ribazole phosphatase